PSGFYKVGHIYKSGPADHDYLKIAPGNFIVSIDGHALKTSENYWRYFTIASGNKFHLMVNDKPAADGAWEVTITPVNGGAVGDPTMAAVIGTGSYTLLDGSAIRTPGSGVWTSTGQNMENYGVPPDVYIDNTPSDHLKGRDMQVEKAVEVLKADLAAAPKKTTSQQQR